MHQIIKGLIIHHIRYSDSKFIVRIFCEHHGLKSFIVQHSKSAKSSGINLLQPLNIVEFESAPKENAQIHTLKNLRIAYPLHHIHFDPVKSAMVMFLDEILYKTIPDDYVNDKLYRFLVNAVILLDDAVDARNFHLWCLMEISRMYGFYPQDENDTLQFFDLSTSSFEKNIPIHPHFIEGDVAHLLANFINKEWPEVQSMSIPNELRKKLLDALVLYIRLHLDNHREIESLAILHEVFHS